MKKILYIFPFFLLTATAFAQTNEGRFLERLDSIVCDNGMISKFTYDEQFRTVMKNTFMGDKLVRKEVSEYTEDGTLSSYCVYEEREGQFVLVHKKGCIVKDDGRCVEITDSVYVDDLKKMSPNTCETLTYDENGNLISRCTMEYDLQSDGKSYKLHDINYDAEGNKTEEVIVGPEYKYTKEYKDGRLYVMTKYENRDDQWVVMESTVREYYDTGVLKSEYTYDYSGVVFYMKNYIEYDENGEKIKSQEELQTYRYKYIRDEKGRVKEIDKSLFGSDEIVSREVFYYDQLPIDSAYYTLLYSSDATEPYAKYYYIPNLIVDGKMVGGYSVYEKSVSDGSWGNLMADDNELSHSFGDKNISAHYEENDETISFTDYTLITYTDYGKIIRKQENGSLISEDEIYYDKSLSGSLIAGLEEKYKVSQVISRDADGNEMKGIYFYTSLVENTSVARLSSISHPSVYNLHGQRFEYPQKGINIIEGRKIIFR